MNGTPLFETLIVDPELRSQMENAHISTRLCTTLPES